MKKLGKIAKSKITEMYCNCCGKPMHIEKGLLKEGAFQASYEWGYFSGKDGDIHTFDLCEECYDKIVGGFVIPVEKKEAVELV